MIAFETLPKEPSIWVSGWKFISVSSDGTCVTISYFRPFFKKDELIISIVEDFNSSDAVKNKKRFFIKKINGSGGNLALISKSNNKNETPVDPGFGTGRRDCYRPVFWSKDDLGQITEGNPFDALYLDSKLMNVVEEFERWSKSRDWFVKKEIPWKRGYLLEGTQGSGKTSFVRALGQNFDFPIYIFNLSTMNNSEFLDEWKSAKNSSPCICLFEDIDAVFDKRKNIASTEMFQGVTFDCFLNAIDGVERNDGIVTIITTNNIDAVDSSLCNTYNGEEMTSRPGRIDRVIHFNSLGDEGKKFIAQKILGDFDRKDWEFLLEGNKEDTASQFQERCCRLALKLFWGKKDGN
jgi:hypothetical protein